MRQYFRGRLIVEDVYPAVWWPEHPTARPNGLARIHRIIVFERDGTIPKGLQVHHIDGNPWNWDSANLEVLSNSAHQRRHRGEKRRVLCAVCSKEFAISNCRYKRSKSGKNFCSDSCSSKAQEKTPWPERAVLSVLVVQQGYTAVGKLLGVSDNAVRKRLKKYADVAQLEERGLPKAEVTGS